MKYIRFIYNVLWLKFHAKQEPVDQYDPTPVLYPSWKEAIQTARSILEKSK